MTDKIDDAVRSQLGKLTGRTVAALFPEVLHALPDRFEMLGISAQLQQLFAHANSRQLMAELTGKPLKDSPALRHAARIIQTELIDTGVLLKACGPTAYGWRFLSDDVIERVLAAAKNEGPAEPQAD
jgi:hypothetical protein